MPLNLLEPTISEEKNHYFLCYCSFISLINDKKMNTSNILIMTLKNPKYMKLLKSILNIDNNQEAVRVFLENDPSLYKSKHVLNFVSKIS